MTFVSVVFLACTVLLEFLLSCWFPLLCSLSTFRLLIGFTEDPTEPSWKGYFYAALMVVTALVQSVFLQQYFHVCFTVGMRLRSAVINAVYKKVRVMVHWPGGVVCHRQCFSLFSYRGSGGGWKWILYRIDLLLLLLFIFIAGFLVLTVARSASSSILCSRRRVTL